MNTWDQRFQGAEYVYGEQPNAFIKDYVYYSKDYLISPPMQRVKDVMLFF